MELRTAGTLELKKVETNNSLGTALPEELHNMPPPSPNSSAVPTSALNGNSSFNAASEYKQYVFTPAGLDVKLTVSALIVVAAAAGFAGNLCVLRFTNNEEKKPMGARSSTLNFFIRSLALSDVLGSLIGAPFVIVHLNFDVLLTKWSCRITRFFQIVFIVITNYNLVVIAVERYICTCRPTSRPLSSRTVRKAVKAAWLLGFLLSLGFSYSIDAIRVDLDSTQYTLTCEYEYGNRVAMLTQLVRSLLGYILPSIILIFTCISIWRMLCKQERITPGASSNPEVINKWRIMRKKITIQLLVIIIAFAVPYSFFVAYAVFKAIFLPSMDFKTDYTIRAVATLLAYLNGCANFAIHLSQLVGFRKAMAGYISCCKFRLNAGRFPTIKLNHAVLHKEPKAPPASKGKKSSERRASMSQVQDTEKRQETETRRHSC